MAVHETSPGPLGSWLPATLRCNWHWQGDAASCCASSAPLEIVRTSLPPSSLKKSNRTGSIANSQALSALPPCDITFNTAQFGSRRAPDGLRELLRAHDSLSRASSPVTSRGARALGRVATLLSTRDRFSDEFWGDASVAGRFRRAASLLPLWDSSRILDTPSAFTILRTQRSPTESPARNLRTVAVEQPARPASAVMSIRNRLRVARSLTALDRAAGCVAEARACPTTSRDTRERWTGPPYRPMAAADSPLDEEDRSRRLQH